MSRTVLPTVHPRGDDRQMRTRHGKQHSFVTETPTRRLVVERYDREQPHDETVRVGRHGGQRVETLTTDALPVATRAGRQAEGSTIAMVNWASEGFQETLRLAHLTCGQCFEPRHDGRPCE
jgi:hypothetical protein